MSDEDQDQKTTKFTYVFDYENGGRTEFIVELDAKTFALKPRTHEQSEDWTKLPHNKCDNCTLKEEDSPMCPIAANIADLVEQFKDSKSFWKAKVMVVAPERAYFKNTDVQSGLFSIFGLIMATSKCPHMEFLRPMARYHLPFSTVEETIVRSMSMFLLRQHLEITDGKRTEFDLKELEGRYDDLNKINRALIARVRGVAKGDSDGNAILILDSFAMMLSNELGSDLDSIRAIFQV